MLFETISVIGLGYIGLPTAAMFAAYGKNVIGVDVNQHAVDTINRGKIHIVEPELDAIVKKAVNEQKLRAVLSPEPADAFLIAVPTPFLSNKKQSNIPRPDLSYIEQAAKGIAKVLKTGDLVILESTSPVGATEKMAQWLANERTDLTFPQTHGENSDIRIAHCPERVLPGHVVRELVENDRVIGGMTPKCSVAAIELYKIFVQGECIVTNARTAEMAKLTENASRDVSIAFANELSIICDKVDIDVWELISLANRHPRVNILQPGPGVGGHCIAVDPWFIVDASPEEAKLIKTARDVNDSKPSWVIEKIKSVEKIIEKPVIACLGLSFKADIDDLRESPAMEIVEKLAEIKDRKLLLIEPNIIELPVSLKNKTNISLSSIDEVNKLADIIVLLVDHKEFIAIERKSWGNKVIIDIKGIW